MSVLIARYKLARILCLRRGLQRSAATTTDDWAGRNHKLLKSLGLPAPYPLVRRRDPAATSASPSQLLLGGGPVGVVALSGHVAAANYITETVHTYGGTSATDMDSISPIAAIVVDATAMQELNELEQVYQVLQRHLRKLSPNGRVVLVAPHPTVCVSSESAAASHALKGFTKSLAKELAAYGTTVNLVQTVAVEACTGTLAFLLSDRAAFITGQCIQTARPPQHPRTKSPRAHMQGRNVLLTGASQGIGEVTARLLAAAGANLLLLDHPQTETRISELAKNLECEYLTADVTSRDTPTRVVESIRTTFGGTVHAAIHNAGITADKTFRRMDAQLFTRVIDVNLRAVIAQTTAMLSGDKPSLAEDGRIVCVSSVNGIAGAFGQTNYAASKSGIIGYVSHMQHVLDKVAINAVAPGFICTSMTNAMPFLSRVVASRANALMQPGYPIDVAEALLFLASELSVGLHGQTLRVCGGNVVGE